MRPIDADALKDRLQALAYDDWNQGVSTSWAEAFSEVADMVEEQPTIDAVQERLKGRWLVKHDEIFADMHFCSRCGELANVDLYGEEILSAYCPNCGAKMERTEE